MAVKVLEFVYKIASLLLIQEPSTLLRPAITRNLVSFLNRKLVVIRDFVAGCDVFGRVNDDALVRVHRHNLRPAVGLCGVSLWAGYEEEVDVDVIEYTENRRTENQRLAEVT